MKHIVKQHEPAAFSEWKAEANENWTPTFDTLSGTPKKAVVDSLLEEQGWICCYCERRLNKQDSHIEHLRPQNDPHGDPLDYNNMVRSCQNRLKKSEPRHCGNRKENWYDPALFVSPLDPGCEERFKFLGDRSILPSDPDDQGASVTILKLGLNLSKLNALRVAAITPFLGLDTELSDVEFRTFVAGYLVRDASDRFGEFWTTIRYLFG